MSWQLRLRASGLSTIQIQWPTEHYTKPHGFGRILWCGSPNPPEGWEVNVSSLAESKTPGAPLRFTPLASTAGHSLNAFRHRHPCCDVEFRRTCHGRDSEVCPTKQQLCMNLHFAFDTLVCLARRSATQPQPMRCYRTEQDFVLK